MKMMNNQIYNNLINIITNILKLINNILNNKIKIYKTTLNKYCKQIFKKFI